jgi:hypothetical protein
MKRLILSTVLVITGCTMPPAPDPTNQVQKAAAPVPCQCSAPTRVEAASPTNSTAYLSNCSCGPTQCVVGLMNFPISTTQSVAMQCK